MCCGRTLKLQGEYLLLSRLSVVAPSAVELFADVIVICVVYW